ncbi:hypothetical protein F8M41_007707 [Gigaspora margarita]|uniref:Uncharacterized protein n=1 Tax=Gigaspora margarita TaxID=4874 RepID=A0A8H3X598_GIGMA|nr:hypothetical protein F8M41_007707 [Gigaspora margarita]
MWLERSSLNEEQNFDQAHPKKKVPAKQNESIISQSVFPSYDEMQKSFQAMFDKRDTEQKAEIAKRDASHKAEIEKLKTEFESKMTKQTQIPASQTIESVRRPRGPPSLLQTKEDMEHYRLTQYLNNLGIFSTEDLDRNYPIKPFQRSHPQRSNVSARIDRVEEVINENRNAMNQLTEEFQKLNIHKSNIAKSNFNRSYFTPLKPINLAKEKDNRGGYDEEENIWYDSLEKKTTTRYKGILTL